LGCVKKPQKGRKWISLIVSIFAVGLTFIGFGGPKSTHCFRLIAKRQL
jgi:hypothetical protein